MNGAILILSFSVFMVAIAIPFAVIACKSGYTPRLFNMFRRPPEKPDQSDILLRLLKEKSALEELTFTAFQYMIHALCRTEGESNPDDEEIRELFDAFRDDFKAQK
jgi:hypothetical protein